MAKNKKLETETKNNELENNENKQETTNMENNENKQETTNMENNENKQENTIAEKWNTVINSAVDVVKLSIETAINTAIERLGKSPVMVKLETEINELETAKNGQTVETIINAIETAINAKNNELETAKKSLYNDVYGSVISAITGKKSVKSNNGNNVKTDNENKYTVNMAILDVMTNDWQTAKQITDKIEQLDKLPSIHTNEGWKRTVSTAFIGLMEKNIIERNDKHEYRKIA